MQDQPEVLVLEELQHFIAILDGKALCGLFHRHTIGKGGYQRHMCHDHHRGCIRYLFDVSFNHPIE